MAVDKATLAHDLVDEAEDLARLVWESTVCLDTATPAPGWTIRDQLTHLAFFDDIARQAIEQPEEFRAWRAELGDGSSEYVEQALARGAGMSRDELVGWLTESRRALATLVEESDLGRRVPWFGPDMTIASKATARIMETWAHGQDVADALGVSRAPTHRLRHVAHIGVRALPHSFRVHGMAVPEEAVYVALTGPDGDSWTWGPDDAPDRVVGPAEDFCLVVTRRRHVDDTRLEVTGATAVAWMHVAQAYAGKPGAGPRRIDRME